MLACRCTPDAAFPPVDAAPLWLSWRLQKWLAEELAISRVSVRLLLRARSKTRLKVVTDVFMKLTLRWL